jgi:cobalt transporter subunit CbtA
MFRNILLSAGIAGLLAALLLTLVQMALITPLILQAETFEAGPAVDAAPEHAHAAPAAVAHDHATHDHSGHDHSNHEQVAAPAEHAGHDHHDADEWSPADGLERTLFTLASNVVMGFAYALLLVGVYVGWHRPAGALQGLLFGLAGFAVFFAAPGLGLPPELPGTAAAELGARQQWWLAAALAAAVGLALICMQKNNLLRGLGLAILVAPHLVGAPHLAEESSLAPMELQHQFRLATTLGNAAFWMALGAISAVALQKFSTPQRH